MSTFYADGHADGYAGRPRNPPAPFVRADGQSTDVFAREYADGYDDGAYARVHQPTEREFSTEGWCDDVNPGHLIPN